MKLWIKKLLFTLVVTTSFASASFANAETMQPTADFAQVTELISTECIKALVISDVQDTAPSQCEQTQGLVVGDEELASQEEIVALATTQKISVQAFSTLAPTIYAKNFSKTYHDLFWGFDVVISGRFYYDYSRVWVTQTYAGKVGSLTCYVSYAPGINLTNTSCTDTGTFYVRTLTGRFHAVVNGSGNSFDRFFYLNVDDTGYVYIP
jgi:hypothetical protein